MKSPSAEVAVVLRPVAAAVAAMLIPLSASADTKTWACASGAWNDAACWQAAGVPGFADAVSVGSSSHNTNVLIDNNTDASSNTLFVNGGLFASNRVTQSGGTNSSNTLTIGQGSQRSGSYTLTGGSLLAGIEVLGTAGGVGSFVQSGGSQSVGVSITLGDTADSVGSYTLSGGALNGGRQILVGNQGLGLFNQSGGSVKVDSYVVGQAAGSAGYARIANNGQLSVSDLRVGVNGVGYFNQTGSSNVTAQTLAIGKQGVYNLSGGTLRSSLSTNQGLFTLAGGTLTGNLTNNGSFNFTGGSLAGRLTNNGTATVRGNLSAPLGLVNSGQIQFASGTSSIGAFLANQAGGSIQTATGASVTVTGSTQNDGSWAIQHGAQVTFAQYAGTGTLSGAGSARFLSNFSTGHSTAAISIDVDSTFADTADISLKLAGVAAGNCAACHDQITFSKGVTLSGDLTVQWASGWQGANGDTYDLFGWTSTHTGSFSQVLLPTLATGLAWDTSALYTSGEISIHTITAANPSSLGAIPASFDLPITQSVPEPQTYALLLAGLLILGHGATKRRERR